MRIAGIKFNDIVDGEGICVSLWMQGCPHRCEGCHNPETWSFNGGYEISEEELTDTILESINKNNIKRNFSILGGEPLCNENLFLTELVIREVKKVYPEVKIYLWTGYLYNDLINKTKTNNHLSYILSQLDKLVDGPFKIEERDITLYMRGSRNQKIFDLK